MKYIIFLYFSLLKRNYRHYCRVSAFLRYSLCFSLSLSLSLCAPIFHELTRKRCFRDCFLIIIVMQGGGDTPRSIRRAIQKHLWPMTKLEWPLHSILNPPREVNCVDRYQYNCRYRYRYSCLSVSFILEFRVSLIMEKMFVSLFHY